MVATISVIMYKNLEISNKEIGLFVSMLYLPWLLKPLWSPIVDVLRTKRFWIVSMQLALAVGFVGVGLSLPLDNFVRYSLICFWILAVFSATHDIAADGFYMLGLTENLQSVFVGIRSLFYRFAVIFASGPVVIFAGYLEGKMEVAQAWQIVYLSIAALVALFALYHWFLLPRIEQEESGGKAENQENLLENFREVFASFFQKKQIVLILSFLLVYRLGEALLNSMVSPFLLDDLAKGGLGISTEEVGWVKGTVGVIGLIVGGILGGIAISLHGLKHWIWWMLVAINLPNVVYIFLAFTQPDSLILISSYLAVEQFGYGFGFAAYLMYMIYVADGPYKTAHYALCTAFMAAGLMIPGLISGYLQEFFGYQNFFIFVLIATIPSFIITYFIPIDPEFGKKRT